MQGTSRKTTNALQPARTAVFKCSNSLRLRLWANVVVTDKYAGGIKLLANRFWGKSFRKFWCH